MSQGSKRPVILTPPVRGRPRRRPVKDDLYAVKVVRTRVVDGEEQSLVHWAGWGSSADEWIPSSSIEQLDRSELGTQEPASSQEKAKKTETKKEGEEEGEEGEEKGEEEGEEEDEEETANDKQKKGKRANPPPKRARKGWKKKESKEDEEEEEEEGEEETANDKQKKGKRAKPPPKRSRKDREKESKEDEEEEEEEEENEEDRHVNPKTKRKVAESEEDEDEDEDEDDEEGKTERADETWTPERVKSARRRKRTPSGSERKKRRRSGSGGGDDEEEGEEEEGEARPRKRPWTAEEVKQLERAAKASGTPQGFSWTQVASRLGTRTPKWDRLQQCRTYYKSKKQMKERERMIQESRGRPWTKDEEAKLMEVVAERGLHYDSEMWVALEPEFKRSAGALQLRWSELHGQRGGAVDLDSGGEGSEDFDKEKGKKKRRKMAKKGKGRARKPASGGSSQASAAESDHEGSADRGGEGDQVDREGEEDEEDGSPYVSMDEEGEEPMMMTMDSPIVSLGLTPIYSGHDHDADEEDKASPEEKESEAKTKEKKKKQREEEEEEEEENDVDHQVSDEEEASEKLTKMAPKKMSRSRPKKAKTKAKTGREKKGKDKEMAGGEEEREGDEERDGLPVEMKAMWSSSSSPFISSDGSQQSQARRKTPPTPTRPAKGDREHGDGEARNHVVEVGYSPRQAGTTATAMDDRRDEDEEDEEEEEAAREERREREREQAEALRRWVERKRESNLERFGQRTLSPNRSSRGGSRSRKRRPSQPAVGSDDYDDEQAGPRKRRRTMAGGEIDGRSTIPEEDVDDFLMGKERPTAMEARVDRDDATVTQEEEEGLAGEETERRAIAKLERIARERRQALEAKRNRHSRQAGPEDDVEEEDREREVIERIESVIAKRKKAVGPSGQRPDSEWQVVFAADGLHSEGEANGNAVREEPADNEQRRKSLRAEQLREERARTAAQGVEKQRENERAAQQQTTQITRLLKKKRRESLVALREKRNREVTLAQRRRWRSLGGATTTTTSDDEGDEEEEREMERKIDELKKLIARKKLEQEEKKRKREEEERRREEERRIREADERKTIEQLHRFWISRRQRSTSRSSPNFRPTLTGGL